MEYTLNDKYKLIKEEVLKSLSKNPIEIAEIVWADMQCHRMIV